MEDNVIPLAHIAYESEAPNRLEYIGNAFAEYFVRRQGDGEDGKQLARVSGTMDCQFAVGVLPSGWNVLPVFRLVRVLPEFALDEKAGLLEDQLVEDVAAV